jgi:hypothetical protein
MGYLKIFSRVAQFVRSRGVEVKFEMGKAVTARMVKAAQRKLPVRLPGSLIDFYREVGDGVEFRWIAADRVFAVVEFRPLKELVSTYLYRRSYSVEYDEKYEYPHVTDRARAKLTATRMRHWIAFHFEGNGDEFALDTSVTPEPVVFDQHDWYDGGDGGNGMPMGCSLLQFMEDWSRVCFHFPSSLWWPRVLTEAGVNWDSDEFDDKFRMPDSLMKG